MTRSAQVIRPPFRHSQGWKAFVRCSDGTNSYDLSFVYDGSLEHLKRQVRNWFANHESFEASAGQVSDQQIIDATAVVADPPPPPTQAEIDRLAFIDAWRTYCHYDNAVNVGLITPTNANYLAAKADVQARYQPSYLSLLVTV